jgi:hypothetical protein
VSGDLTDDRPWELAGAPTYGLPARDHGAADLNAAQIALDDLARERAASRNGGARAGHVARAVCDRIEDSPCFRTDPMLAACAHRLRLGHEPVETIVATLLAYAEDRARLLDLATRATALSGPVALAPCDAFAAPAHNPGARVVPTGGGR